MSKLRFALCYILYYTVGFYLPKTNARISLGSRKIRELLVKGFAEGPFGKNINIQRKATISHRISIGDYSSIGMNSVVQGGGKNWKKCNDGASGLYIHTEPSA